MSRRLWFIFFLVCFSAVWFRVDAQSKRTSRAPRVGRTLAGVTVGQDTLDKVRFLYGRGAETTASDIQTLCYHYTKNDSYLSVSTFERQTKIRSVAVTALTDATPGCHDATKTGAAPIGPSGIKLGDSIKTVIAAVGKPSKKGKVQAGTYELEYADYAIVGGQLSCQFEDNKLTLIVLELH